MNRTPHFIVFPPPPPYTLPTLHRQHIELTSNAHRAYIDSTSTQHRPDIDATLSFYFNTVPWIVKLYIYLHHCHIFIFSLHCYHHRQVCVIFSPPTPPPERQPHFFCFSSTNSTTTTATAMLISIVFLPDRLFRWPVSSFLHLLPDFGYFGRSLAFLAWF